jgi:hypothetical protein
MSHDFKNFFQDKVIKVGGGGPESRIGMLLDESADYIAVLTEEDGVVYYNTNHMKSFTANVKEKNKFEVEIPEDFEYKKAETFNDLVGSLVHSWVKINRGGPNAVEGIIAEVKNDFVYVVSNQEIVSISMFHINNVSYGLKFEKAESEGQESRQKSNGKSENKRK